ncbi:MAG: ATP-binding protein [Sulfurimonadaceae bacterium]|jgi:PAS domain S-box-containing protein
MQYNSILFRVMLPLGVIVALIMIVTLFVTENFLKRTVEEVYIKSEVNHLKSTVNSKIDNQLMRIIRDSMVIATCPDTAAYLSSPHAKDGILSQEMKAKLRYFKEFYHLETVYIAELQTRNYFNETGLVKVVDLEDQESKWFMQTLQNRSPYTVNVDSFLTGEMTIWVDAIVHEGHRKVGLAGGGMKIANILQPIQSVLSHLRADALFVDQTKTVRAATRKDIELNLSLEQSSLKDTKKYKVLIDALDTNKEFVSYEGEGGELHHLLLIPVNSLEWVVVIDFPNTTFLEPLQGVLSHIFTSGVLILVSIMFFVWAAFSYMVARPLKKISQELEAYDYHSEFQPKGCVGMGYEVDTICKAFQKSASLLRKTLQNYRESEELLRNVTNATDDLIFYKNKEKRYIGFNKAYEKWTGKKHTDLLGFNDYDFYPEDVAQKHDQSDTLVLETKKAVMIEEELLSASGEKVYLHINKSPLWNNDGTINGIVGVARDITHIKNLEKELRELNANLENKVHEKTEALQISVSNLQYLNGELKKAKERALNAAQARSNFISSVSHELRTPMNAIINFTDQILEDFDEILEDEELQKESKHYLERVLVNAKHLLHLINELLEFTKAESGKIDYDIQQHNINEVIDTAYTNTYSLLINTNIEYRISCAKETLLASVDSRRLLQVLLNLLSNAIKFTKNGFIEIRSFGEDEFVVIEIEDTGRGISQDKMKIIFDPFVQANRDDAGTGLGLGLAKRMCEDMGIVLEVRSQENVGTVFTLRLKRAL